MRNVTYRADAALVARARAAARRRATTLNELFRGWLADLAREPELPASYDRLMKRLGHVRSGRKFSRAEMNER